jgi:hypothetical protein
MVRCAAGVVALALLAACSAGDSPAAGPSPSAPSSPSAIASSGPAAYGLEGCPVTDEDLCATAIDVIEALQDGDATRLFELSREDRLVCAELATEYFPGCETDDVLRGYGLSGADFTVEVVDGDAYRRRLEVVVDDVDPSFADNLGDGSPRVVGVGTCGPDVPGRRSYHLAWTAAVSEDDAAPERVLGSFELTFEDDWRIALWYLDPLETWETLQDDPLELAFCEAGLSPWPPERER